MAINTPKVQKTQDSALWSPTAFPAPDNIRLEKNESIRSPESSDSASTLVAANIPSRPEKDSNSRKTGLNEAVSRKARAMISNEPTSVAKAYTDMVEKTKSIRQTFQAHSHERRMNRGALTMALNQLTADRVKKQKEIIRFNALKNEIDIFQQHLTPFIFEMYTDHEHQVNSAVYRHRMRMKDIQDMGIAIYSLNNDFQSASDKVITPKNSVQTFYRRVKRRRAADFLDNDLIPRPEEVQQKKRSIIEEKHTEQIVVGHRASTESISSTTLQDQTVTQPALHDLQHTLDGWSL